MAALDLGASLTLAEMIRRETPDGKLADFVDVLSQENRILEDITWIQCNNGTYHEDTLVAFEPGGSERAYNEGVTKEEVFQRLEALRAHGLVERLTEAEGSIRWIVKRGTGHR